MGGFGSGRYDQFRSTGSIEQALKIDIRVIQRGLRGREDRWLPLSTAAPVSIAVSIVGGACKVASLGAPEGLLIASINLLEQPRHFGGHQHYLLCPQCEQQYLILYLDHVEKIACRKCLRLCYASQYESHPAPNLTKANRLRLQLGGKAGLINPLPVKPKYMHWNTYLSKMELIQEFEQKHKVEMKGYKTGELARLDQLTSRYDLA